jgi:hypothetical protein
MCQSTSTMKREIFDAFFSDFFFTRFFIIDFNETSKEQKKDFQFFNLFKKLFTSSRQNEETFFWRKRRLASEAVCLQRFARRKHHSSFLFLFFSFFFFFSLFIFIFFFFFSLFSRKFELSSFFERIRFETSTRFFLLTKKRKSIVMSKRKYLKKRVETS